MTRAIHKLSNRQMETIKKAGRYSDGGGLYLRVTNKSAKRWVFRFTPPGGGSREIGLGSAGKQSVGLARARELAQKARDAVLDGKDPVIIKPNLPASAPEAPLSFGAFADDYVAISGEMRCGPYFIEDVEPLSFAAYIRGTTKSAVKLSISYGAMESLPKLDEEDLTAQRKAMRLRYATHYKRTGSSTRSADHHTSSGSSADSPSHPSDLATDHDSKNPNDLSDEASDWPQG